MNLKILEEKREETSTKLISFCLQNWKVQNAGRLKQIEDWSLLFRKKLRDGGHDFWKRQGRFYYFLINLNHKKYLGPMDKGWL